MLSIINSARTSKDQMRFITRGFEVDFDARASREHFPQYLNIGTTAIDIVLQQQRSLP